MMLGARRGGALSGTAAIPGDKSCSHRALILAALAEGETRIDGLLDSADVRVTIAAIEAFGAQVTQDGQGWCVSGAAWRSPAGPIDCGNSGTAARLLVGAAAGVAGIEAEFVGDASLSQRPMARVTAPLSRMGARFDGAADHLPLRLSSERLGGISHRNLPASAQVKSAILLAGLGTAAPVAVIEPLPARDHSEIMLGEFGCDVAIEQRDGERTVVLGPRRSPVATRITIGADPSSAAFPLLAAAIVPGSGASVNGINVNPLRTGFYETLEAMGADIALDRERLVSGEILSDIAVAHAALRPCEVEASMVPAMIDEIPALAVACAFADGESIIPGLGELRFKESDRLGAIVAGLAACGVAAVVRGDSLHIFGRSRVPGGAKVATHGDHRIAMAFLVLGLASEEPVTVDHPGMIATSFPTFVAVMRSLGGQIEEQG
jgi:3-phosphoshikimate 1-carboxyvinyltransferase